MMRIRPDVSRRYYEAVLDGRYTERYACANATFEEYVALVQLHHPHVSRRWAVEHAAMHGRPDLASHPIGEDPPSPAIDDLMRPLAEVAQEHKVVRLLKREAVDLRGHIDPATRGVECVNGTISGWEALRRSNGWLEISLFKCTTEEDGRLTPPIVSAVVRASRVDDRCLSFVLSSTRARALEIEHERPFDLRSLRGQTALEMLCVSAPLIHGARDFAPARLRDLRLSGADVQGDDGILALLRAAAPTLETLHLGGVTGFSPERLPTMDRLRILRVVASASWRDAWLEYAAAHDDVGVDFRGPSEPSKIRYEAVAALDDADVLSVTKGARTSFELHAVIEPLHGDALGRAVAAAARAEKRRAKWSHAGSFAVVSAADPETCRWARDIIASTTEAWRAEGGKLSMPEGPAKKTRPRKPKTPPPARLFEAWEGTVDPGVLRRARKIMEDTAGAIANLPGGAPEEVVRPILERCIRSFNALDRAKGFITSIEAEGICDAFEAIVASTSVREKNLADAWRDW